MFSTGFYALAYSTNICIFGMNAAGKESEMRHFPKGLQPDMGNEAI